ncbi:MAG: beta-ketoacyl-ACP reductase [Alphaproteobacteria bacterium]|nr:beta-ketoacyl-ACP reductase [Alphaproteobacteria bacterium]NCQ88793.1 beta-ketoacyl-ACP reductase [Alphaproteobacteria bacterium]NCT07284.1 beta-ketoacyl-ACP reductase [Alphaproteobacteria bacterium]
MTVALKKIANDTQAPPKAEPVRKIALVTGGTGGIGSAICKKLCDMGCLVITTYRNEEKAKAWQEEMRQMGYEPIVKACDVSDFASCQSMVSLIEQDYGPINILVNNAGITKDSTFKKMNVQQWRDVMTCNLDSVFNVTRCVIESMLDRGYGRVINISSINAQKGQFGQTNYSAAKAGMHGFTKALAQEVARKGITVNTISPGYIATDMVMAVPEDVRNNIIAQIPVGRLGKPEEIAHIIEFLVSDSSGFITGSNIAANGGQHMD